MSESEEDKPEPAFAKVSVSLRFVGPDGHDLESITRAVGRAPTATRRRRDVEARHGKRLSRLVGDLWSLELLDDADALSPSGAIDTPLLADATRDARGDRRRSRPHPTT